MSQRLSSAIRYVMLVKIANKDTESVVSALIKQSQRLPSELYRSLTWDRGKELADHPRLTLATEVEVYFCDPRCPWQRGSNENTNRLLRQYLPRGTDLSLHSQAKLSAIARQLNERPRKTLLYQSPAEKFAECVAAIGRTRHPKRSFAKWVMSASGLSSVRLAARSTSVLFHIASKKLEHNEGMDRMPTCYGRPARRLKTHQQAVEK
jgi:hypothetical protein